MKKFIFLLAFCFCSFFTYAGNSAIELNEAVEVISEKTEVVEVVDNNVTAEERVIVIIETECCIYIFIFN